MSLLNRTTGALYRRPRLRLSLLLTAPLLWLAVLYLGSLSVLFVSAFWTTDSFTSEVVKVWSTDNFHELFTVPVYRQVILRSIGVALAVTALCAVIAFPLAFYTARVAKPRWRPLLVVAILTPLWASYLVKVYAWRLILSQGGLADWVLKPFGLSGPGFGLPATVLTLTYLWLPYMVLPIHTALEQLPANLLDASADLGARAGRTFRSVVLPMVLPSVAAGFDLHLLAQPRRLHHRADRRRQDPAHRQPRLLQHRAQPAHGRRPRHRSRRRHRGVPARDAPHGRTQQPVEDPRNPSEFLHRLRRG